MEIIFFVLGAIIWYGIGLFFSFIGWLRISYRYGYESFWQPFYLTMALFGPLNAIGALTV